MRRFTSNSQFLGLGCALGGDIGSLGAVGTGPLGLRGLGKGKAALLARGIVWLIISVCNPIRGRVLEWSEAFAVPLDGAPQSL